jgi:hypothetical protein
MKQSPMDMLIFGSALAIVLGLTVAISTTPGIQTGGSHASGMPSTAFTQAYRGPSTDYAATPDTEILTYDEPGYDPEKPGDSVEAHNTGEAQLTVAPG